MNLWSSWKVSHLTVQTVLVHFTTEVLFNFCIVDTETAFYTVLQNWNSYLMCPTFNTMYTATPL